MGQRNICSASTFYKKKKKLSFLHRYVVIWVQYEYILKIYWLATTKAVDSHIKDVNYEY